MKAAEQLDGRRMSAMEMTIGTIVVIILVSLGLTALKRYDFERRSWQIAAAFPDERLRAIADDESVARDFEMALVRICAFDRAWDGECKLLANAGVLDRWRALRPQGELAAWERGRQLWIQGGR